MNDLTFVKLPLRSSTILHIENDDKKCFFWSKQAHFHPCENSLPNRVSNYEQFFIEINFDGIEFSNEFNCSNMHKIEDLNCLSKHFFKVSLHQIENKQKPKFIPIENFKNNSDKLLTS